MKHLAGMVVGVAALMACVAVQAQDDPDFLSVSAGRGVGVADQFATLA